MRNQFSSAAAEIADTSYSCAVEHALSMGAHGMTPRQVLESIGMPDAFKNPTWEDAVFALAHVHRRVSNSKQKSQLPKHVFSGLNVTKQDHEDGGPTPRWCLKCKGSFESHDRRICPSCTKANRQFAGGDLGGLYA